MHLLAAQPGGIADGSEPVDLGQSPTWRTSAPISRLLLRPSVTGEVTIRGVALEACSP